MMHRFTMVSCLLATLGFAASAEARIPFASAPEPNAKQKKYLTFKNEAGGLACEAKGELKKLLKQQRCYLSLDKCDASADAVAGKASAARIQLYADLIEHDGSKFVNHCPGEQNFWEVLGIYGLGYAQSTKHAPLIAKLVTKARLPKAGANVTEAAAFSLWYLGNKKVGAPVMANIVGYKGMWAKGARYKQPALQALGRWGDKSGMGWCLKYMKEGKSGELKKSCVVYSGAVRDKRAAPIILRNLDDFGEVGIRALGLIGDKSAVGPLEELVAEGNMWGKTAVPLVALLNLGKKDHWDTFATMLEGKRPLTTKEKAKFDKAKAKAEGKKPKKRDKAIAKYEAKLKKRLDKYEEKVHHAALMEAILLKAPGKRDALLRKAAATKATKKAYKAHVYGNVALAQLGDKKGSAALAKLLGSAQEKQREAVVSALGGSERAYLTWLNRGRAGVADQALVAALLKYRGNESKDTRRQRAIRAAATTRAFLRAK
jgi:23S rRNA pseudoU1915 N3-methylase RlmH